MSGIKVGDVLITNNHGQPDRYETRSPVTGETKISWIVGTYGTKVNKKTMLESIPKYGNRQWYTAEEFAEKHFRDEHKRDVAGAVVASATAAQLREIAQIIGMELK